MNETIDETEKRLSGVEPTLIDVTPDFERVFKHFMADADQQVKRMKTKAKTGNDQARREDFALVRTRGLVVALNIACGSVQDTLGFLEFRQRLADLTTFLAKADDERQEDNRNGSVDLERTASQQNQYKPV